jgi:CDP-diacylglycerol--glycerol-3-phosphate 3-phosphatidyltransferase
MKSLPNLISFARIVLTPVVLILLISNTLWGSIGALVLFVIAAISDYVDGKVARSMGTRSRLGQFLDPLADKILVLGTFIALAVMLPALVPWWAVALIALRDVVVTGLRMWAEARGRTLRTIPMAKTKTTLQLTFLIGVLLLLVVRRFQGTLADLAAAARWLLDSPIPFVLLMALVALTVFTGVWYLVNKDYVAPAKFNG